MRLALAALAAVLALQAPSFGQCSTLTVGGALQPGETITVDLTSATPGVPTFLLVGSYAGPTTFDLGDLGILTVGLIPPFTLLSIGTTNGSGALSYSFDIPASIPSCQLPRSLTLQTVSVGLTFGMPLLSFCVSNAATLLPGPLNTREALLQWNRITLDANALDHTPSYQGPPHTSGAQAGPCRTSRALAIVHIAMFETLIAVHGGYQSYVGLAPVTVPVSRPAAIAQAAHDTLVSLFPSQAWIFDGQLAGDLGLIPNGARKTAGINLGQAAAAAILAMRATDGSNQAEPLVNTQFTCSIQPGYWRQDPIVMHPLALGAYWSQVAPFVMTAAAQFRAPAMPPMTSAEYTSAYNEVKALGGDGVTTPTTRTQDQTLAGIYWGYDGSPGLGTPPRFFNQIAVHLADQHGSNALQLARLLALANTAMADAGIACWETKYFYQFWRPNSGIREADAGTGPTGLGDGNPATIGDPTYTALGAPASNSLNPNFTPPFPAYTSGHATFGGATFQTLRRFYGTDNISFTMVSDELNGLTLDNLGNPRPLLPRTFANLSAAEEENGQSRIYLGIHWVFDKTAGITQGNGVGNWVFDHMFVPIP